MQTTHKTLSISLPHSDVPLSEKEKQEVLAHLCAQIEDAWDPVMDGVSEFLKNGNRKDKAYKCFSKYSHGNLPLYFKCPLVKFFDFAREHRFPSFLNSYDKNSIQSELFIGYSLFLLTTIIKETAVQSDFKKIFKRHYLNNGSDTASKSSFDANVLDPLIAFRTTMLTVLDAALPLLKDNKLLCSFIANQFSKGLCDKKDMSSEIKVDFDTQSHRYDTLGFMLDFLDPILKKVLHFTKGSSQELSKEMSEELLWNMYFESFEAHMYVEDAASFFLTPTGGEPKLLKEAPVSVTLTEIYTKMWSRDTLSIALSPSEDEPYQEISKLPRIQREQLRLIYIELKIAAMSKYYNTILRNTGNKFVSDSTADIVDEWKAETKQQEEKLDYFFRNESNSDQSWNEAIQSFLKLHDSHNNKLSSRKTAKKNPPANSSYADSVQTYEGYCKAASHYTDLTSQLEGKFFSEETLKTGIQDLNNLIASVKSDKSGVWKKGQLPQKQALLAQLQTAKKKLSAYLKKCEFVKTKFSAPLEERKNNLGQLFARLFAPFTDLLERIYRPGAKIFDGSTAAAVIHEAKGGPEHFLSPKSHFFKAVYLFSEITQIPRKSLDLATCTLLDGLATDLSDAIECFRSKQAAYVSKNCGSHAKQELQKHTRQGH